MNVDIQKIREDFPILSRTVYGKPLVYFDNGATTQKPRLVVDALVDEYYSVNANVHRGVHYLSQQATELHEASRETVREFINAHSTNEVVFTRGTTESINLLVSSFGDEFMEEGDEVIVSVMEHHSNIVPWQLLAARKGIAIKVIPMNDKGELLLDEYEKLFSERTKIVSVVHVSNVLGTVNPVKEMIATAHAHGVPCLIDAAQSIPHMKVDVQELDADFLVFSGHNLMYENGKLLGEIKPFEDGILIRDFNMTKIRHDRLANKSFAECKRNFDAGEYMTVTCEKVFAEKKEVCARVSMTPFVPSKNRLERCRSIFAMQVAGLQRRIEATHASCIVVGVSGGLDSTLALLVSAQAVKNLGLPPETVTGITMPGFGTTKRTKSNSTTLMELLGCDIREISIVDSVRQHFADIGQDEAVHDITYENCQARERTQILMDVANKEGGFVIGTGDLSELALGWCTYNGDHMSMYAVNTSIPKTLVRTLVDEVGHDMDRNGFPGIKDVIEDIIDTPVSPELLPPNADGTIAQKTEDTVGSYILHDFFLYYTLRYGMEPEEVYDLCKEAVRQSVEASQDGETEAYIFTDEEIKKWQKVFYTRFFRQQFKRNCMPDGVKVGTVSVSPRGDLRLPSEIEFEDFLTFE